MSPSPSVSSDGLRSWPSGKPSLSVSASFGSEPSVCSSGSDRPSWSVSIVVVSSAPWPAVGSVSPGSGAPFRFVSSLPSLTPPWSVSATSGSVFVAPLSASARQCPSAAFVPFPEQSKPSSVPSKRPSSSLSGSSALMRPSPSVSLPGFTSLPSGTPSSSLSASFGSVPIFVSSPSGRPSPSVSTQLAAAPMHVQACVVRSHVVPTVVQSAFVRHCTHTLGVAPVSQCGVAIGQSVSSWH